MNHTDRPDDAGRPIPDLEQLRAAADARVRADVAAAAERREQQAATRSQFGERRRYGVSNRHAAKQARTRLAERHNSPRDGPPDAA